MRSIIFYLGFIGLLQSEIKYEFGSLRKFFGGTEPNSSYDNWVSHVTEGITNEGYNDYGPTWMDRQSNGFGNYTMLSDYSPTLDYWEMIFSRFLLGDTTAVDSMLQDSLESFFYELVIFQDTTQNKVFHILREELDSSFVDINDPNTELDNVTGGFRNSWGMYIMNPTANREQVVIQVPHPCDDFIAPYVALEIFLQTDAFAFMIAGAGREVLWTEIGNYTNNKSLSDPSRSEHNIFQKFQEAVIQQLFGYEPHSPIIFAIHSFDNESHSDRKSVILAAGSQNENTNKPIRDITEDHFDLINFTQEYPVHANQFNNPYPLHVTEYYEVFYDDHCVYDNGEVEFPITLATELRGPSNGVQMLDAQALISGYSVYEPWIHVELDEKPMIFDSSGYSNDSLYNIELVPVGLENFLLILDYYQPFINAIDSYLSEWDSIIDITPPDSIESLIAFATDNTDEVFITWQPVYDSNFQSYHIEADTNDLFTNPLFFDLDYDNSLQSMRKNNCTLTGLNNTLNWFIRIRAVDYFNNQGVWSNVVSSLPPGHAPPDTILSYYQNINLNSVNGEDIDQDSYYIDSTDTFPLNSNTLCIHGNTWKSIDIEPLLIDSGSVIQVFVKIDSISEIQGIGFSNQSNSLKYSLAGTKNLDIQDWITVYQGSRDIGSWNSYRLPLGNDWLAWHDTLSYINSIYFINDHEDSTSNPGSIHYSMLRDLSSNLGFEPLISIQYFLDSIQNNEDGLLILPVTFYPTVDDTDSYEFIYLWDFGDGNYSNQMNPVHNYVLGGSNNYTAVLSVEDETGLKSWSSTTVQLNQEETSFLVKMNFIGDIMMGRRFEEDNGIIQLYGVDALFDPTIEILGDIADITIANLEAPLTTELVPHPTKGIVFRSSPLNVAGLLHAGIDVVSLANNHILDFMEPGMIQTQNILNEAGIYHSGAGMNSYEAYLPAIQSLKGQVVAFLSNSDRTGQYNNYQPYLNAGENKSGFAYMTPYYIRQQIDYVKNISDIIVMLMHAGSEYSLAPGLNYDSFSIPDNFENLKMNPSSTKGFSAVEANGLEIEDYSWRLDRPRMWDRAIRHFAIDEGADLVIVHHPHIIQGVEIYNGKLIAHSLGNFIFDLNYPETYPSMILNTHLNEDGLDNIFIDPLYIDDYLTLPAKGELGNYILDYISMRSRELDTYVHVDSDNSRAYVIIDTSILNYDYINYSLIIDDYKSVILNGEPYFESEPLLIPKSGSLKSIISAHPNITHFRLGREKVWMKNFEDEGSSLWNLNSESETIQDSIFRRGSFSLRHVRTPTSTDNIVTNLEERIPFDNQYKHTVHGFIKTENAKDVTLEIRASAGRSGESIFTTSIDDSISGTVDWRKYWGNIPGNQDIEFCDVRMKSGIPDSGNAVSWFDDVGLIQWDSIQSLNSFPFSIIDPNDINYVQLFFNQIDTNQTLNLELENRIIGELEPLVSNPKVVHNIVKSPNYFHFYDESSGPVGSRIWTINLDTIGYNETASFYCASPGIYEINLTIFGPQNIQSTSTLTIIGLPEGLENYLKGDLNSDGIVNIVDVILCANYVIELFEIGPEEFVAADLDGNNDIDVFDILILSDIVN